MEIHLVDALRFTAALAAGGLVGVAFGKIQELARARNERLQAGGSLNSGWAVMPGSMRRVAFLLIALVLVQFVCPLLFVGASQWCVSGGVVLGYGWVLFRGLAQRRARAL